MIVQDLDILLKCDICGSESIVETREGFTCRDCGIVLDVQKLEYHKPYNQSTIQHAINLGSTQIGSEKERLYSPHFMKLNRFNKLHSIKDNEVSVLARANIEILRILHGLNMPSSYKDLIFAKFKQFRSKLKPGTKYRNLEKLIPICIYITLKISNISISKNELIKISKVSKKDFNQFLLQINKLMPNYLERNRKKYIEQEILEISEHFELGMSFFYQSKRMMYGLWNSIKNTKDDVIASLVVSISILCIDDYDIPVSHVCNKLGIKMSTIHSQVKRLFERYHKNGFISLVKSAEELKKLMTKIDLIEQ